MELSSIDASHAASFTDDTSVPNAALRVSINGQVIKEHPLYWFYRLRSLCGLVGGEIKERAVKTFFGLPLLNRKSLFRTLRKVRIYIVDARPYVAGIADAFEHMLPPGSTAFDFLKNGSNIATSCRCQGHGEGMACYQHNS
jgi:hypothetical protein